MNAFLNPHNSTSSTGEIDVTAHSISLFEENEEPKDTEKEKAILRRQSIVVMEQATNYTGYNVKI